MAQVTITLIDNPEKEHVVDTVFDADPPIDLRPEGERTHELTDAQTTAISLMERLMGAGGLGMPVGPLRITSFADDDDQVGSTIDVDLNEYR